MDFFDLDSLLDDEERQIRDTVGRLVDERVLPIIAAASDEHRFPSELVRDVRDLLGAGGISVEFQAIRHMLNLKSVITYEGTETIHELVVGKELTGHAAF